MDAINGLVITQHGLDELNAELEHRKKTVRKQIADEIKLAREQGDLSENAAYKAAMEDQKFNEARIEELESMIKNAVVTKSNLGDDVVDIGEKFKLVHKQSKREVEYMLVGSSEANPAERKISIESPIGKEVRGKKYGDEVEIDSPAGKVTYVLKKA